MKGSESDLYAFRVKCMMAVFSVSKVAPLLLSQSSAFLMISLIPSRLLSAVGPVTQAVKSSTNAIAPPWQSMRCCTRSALKKRNRIGDRGEPYGNPACGKLRVLDVCLLTWIVAVRSKQKASIQRSRLSGMPLALSLWMSLSLYTPL